MGPGATSSARCTFGLVFALGASGALARKGRGQSVRERERRSISPWSPRVDLPGGRKGACGEACVLLVLEDVSGGGRAWLPCMPLPKSFSPACLELLFFCVCFFFSPSSPGSVGVGPRGVLQACALRGTVACFSRLGFPPHPRDLTLLLSNWGLPSLSVLVLLFSPSQGFLGKEHLI